MNNNTKMTNNTAEWVDVVTIQHTHAQVQWSFVIQQCLLYLISNAYWKYGKQLIGIPRALKSEMIMLKEAYNKPILQNYQKLNGK